MTESGCNVQRGVGHVYEQFTSTRSDAISRGAPFLGDGGARPVISCQRYETCTPASGYEELYRLVEISLRP
jgi:hypothetical protein